MAFRLFGPGHVTVLFLTAVWIAATVSIVRVHGGRGGRALEACNLAFVAAGLVIQHVYRFAEGFWDIRWDLPMQLCDWAFFVLVLAFFTRRRIFYELGYFWGLAGTLQGTLTPHLDIDFPHVKFIYFFLFHSGVVSAAIFNAAALGLSPRPGSWHRVFWISQLYPLTAIPLNFAVQGANYGFLMEKPSGASLLDWFGPWPWYIAALEIAGFCSFALYYIPWFFVNRRAGRETGGNDPF